MGSIREKDKKRRYSNPKEAAAKQKTGFEPTCLKLPKGLPMFKFKKEGVYRINVLPFITGKFNPCCDEGMVHYERTYYVHTNLGLEGRDSYCCLQKNWGKQCPVCQMVGKFTQQGRDQDFINAFRPKKRQLWLFDDVTDVAAKGNRTPEIQLYEASYKGGQGYKGFGELIDAKVTLADNDDPATRFHHLDSKGMTLKIKTAQKSFRGNTYYIADEIDFSPRREVYDEDLMDSIPCLDELPKMLDYEELEKILNQTGEGGGEEKPNASSNGHSTKPSKNDADEMNEEEDDDDDDDDVKNSGAGTEEDEDETPKSKAKDEEEDDWEDGDEQDEDEDDDDEDSEDDDLDDMDDDEDEEEEKPAKKPGKKK